MKRILILISLLVCCIASSQETKENVFNAKNPYFFALKTNLLYDAAAVPNIGVEFLFNKGWFSYGTKGFYKGI